MRNTLLIFLILPLFMGALGCSKDSRRRSSINTHNNGVGRGAGDRDRDDRDYKGRSCSGDTGYIYSDSGSRDGVADAVFYLLTGIANPSDPEGLAYSYVDGRCGSDTGIQFEGTVDTYEGFDLDGENYDDITSDSAVFLTIFDETARKNNLDPIHIDATAHASGLVEGDRAYIEVEWGDGDSFEGVGGVIVFDGIIDYDDEVFYGRVDFENYSHYDDGREAYGTLGEFEVPLCEFFKCR